MSVRIRESSQGLAQRIAADENLSGLADSIQAALFGWDILTRAQQADILGREVVEAEEDELPNWKYAVENFDEEYWE